MNTSSSSQNQNQNSIPILLLKTKSTPNDGYYDEFSSSRNEVSFNPIFIPVLEHKILDDGMNIVRSLFSKKEIGNREVCKYGGLIFTSQRAVEAFALLISEGQQDGDEGRDYNSSIFQLRYC